jgi:hypothetical protein
MSKYRSGDINERSQAKLRSSIRAAEIINKLHAHILDGVKMTNTAVRASEILLRKVSPDMIATALSIQDTQRLPLLTIIPRDQPKPAIEHDAIGQEPHDVVELPVSHKGNPSHSSAKASA